MDAPQTFPRRLRLKRRGPIRKLFDRSRDDVNAVASGDIRAVYRLARQTETGSESRLQVGFAVPRRAGGAVTRNRIKRILRESFRTNQGLLHLPNLPDGTTLTIMLIYRGDADFDSPSLRADTMKVLAAVRDRLRNRLDSPGQ